MTDLEAAAREATPGPWRSNFGMLYAPAASHPDLEPIGDLSSDADARYIALAHPQAILALISELRHETASRERAEHNLGVAAAALDAAVERVRRLEEAIRTALADEESRPGGWGPDVTMVALLRAALEPTR